MLDRQQSDGTLTLMIPPWCATRHAGYYNVVRIDFADDLQGLGSGKYDSSSKRSKRGTSG
jgi:hypothetical protein